MSKSSSYLIDKHVGARVRTRRLMLKLSQEKLGDALGVTFQQVQKYEKGETRIAAGRLQIIANLLRVPIPYFFEGAPVTMSAAKKAIAPSVSFVTEFLADANGQNLCAAFVRITDAKVRRSIVQLVERLAEQQ